MKNLSIKTTLISGYSSLIPITMTQNPLEISAVYMKGVGPRRAEVLSKVGINNLEDLLEYRPRRYLDHRQVVKIADLQAGDDVTVVGEIFLKRMIIFGKKRLVIQIKDSTGVMEAIWFSQPDLFNRIFKENQMVAFSGKVTRYKMQWQMTHPDFDIISEKQEPLHTGQLIPIYPSTQELKRAGLNNYSLRRILSIALKRYRENIPETLPLALIKKYRLLSRNQAYQQMHFPESMEKLHQVWRRFKYEELFYLELLMALRKHYYASPVLGIPIKIDPRLRKEINDGLPFKLTGAQERVLEEICQDLQSGKPMNRLVQGDVGSGKTVVALIAMRFVIANGHQAALMAPTEILAQQHYLNILALAEKSGMRIALLTGSMKEKIKREIHRKVADGEVDLLIGTHALIQETVAFRHLGIVVIDEQHRFGVMQRGNLIEKGETPHVLVMTATPIPRTLALTIYGDLDVSVIDELPPGRRAIQTHWRTTASLDQVFEFVRKRVGAGEQVYVVYPLVEESEKIDLKAATEAYQQLSRQVFPEFRLALLHGRLKMPEKEAIMKRFKEGAIDVLIATTVIEVGVDVPNASIMLIEHAERFGLSQLHQMRGRVGRGAKQSYCVLITPPDISEIARQRMEVMTRTSDGFVIAEEDLRLRGSGEFFGTRQHGMPDLKYADLVSDQNIIQAARKDAFAVVERDPHLRLPEHRVVRSQFLHKFVEIFHLPNIA